MITNTRRLEAEPITSDEWRLCQVTEDTAIFTNAKSFTDLHTDDWDDQPNPVPPFESEDFDYDLLRIKFDAPLKRPTVDRGRGRPMPYPPDVYNNGDQPWLVEVDYLDDPVPDGRIVESGCPPAEFVEVVQALGGTAYLPARSVINGD